jgi:hypothetical protein
MGRCLGSKQMGWFRSCLTSSLTLIIIRRIIRIGRTSLTSRTSLTRTSLTLTSLTITSSFTRISSLTSLTLVTSFNRLTYASLGRNGIIKLMVIKKF